MLAALILAAGAATSPATPASPARAAVRAATRAERQPERSIDQRVSLMEARQMLQSQTLWSLQSALPAEAVKVLGDLDLHLQEDRDRDEKMQRLETTVAQLEQRLQSLELLMGDRSLAEGAAMRIAPAPSAQIGEPVVRIKPQAKSARAHAKGPAAQRAARDSRVATQP